MLTFVTITQFLFVFRIPAGPLFYEKVIYSKPMTAQPPGGKSGINSWTEAPELPAEYPGMAAVRRGQSFAGQTPMIYSMNAMVDTGKQTDIDDNLYYCNAPLARSILGAFSL